MWNTITNKKFSSLLAFLENQAKKLTSLKDWNERCNFSKYLSEYIIKGQQLYLYTEGNISTQDIIIFDNEISKKALLLYNEMSRLLEYLFKNKRQISINDDEVYSLIESCNKMLFISARWNTLQVMKVFDLDRERNKQKVPRRLPLLVEPCFCYDRVLETALGIEHEDGFNPNRGVTCLPPSSGKTYAANCYTNLMIMHFWIRYGESGLIRMTNNGTNAQNYGDQCAKMIEDKIWLNLFPELRKYINAKGQLDCWKNRSVEKLLLKDCNPEVSDSIFMFGVEAGINGKRSMLGAVLDDLSNGLDEMDNDERHKLITDKVMSDVMDRSDDDNSPILVQGTMYNQYDTQNSFIEIWEKKGLKKLPRFKFIRVTGDGKCFTCLVDIEDKNGESIAPELYTQEKLISKRTYFENRGKPYVYNLIYRQKRDSREPKTFDLTYLNTYNYNELSKHKNLDKFTVSMVDTTRRSGNDFFSMPIFKKNLENGKYRLVDCLFEQKSLGINDDPNGVFAKKVCKKIIDSDMIECCLESNTSNTSSALLKSICNGLGYKSCKFRDRYTSGRGKGSTKITRILNMEETIKEYIEFPNPDTLPNGHPLRLFMKFLTSWSSLEGQKKTNPDDAPDSIAMFAEEFIFKKQRKGIIKELPKNFCGIL